MKCLIVCLAVLYFALPSESEVSVCPTGHFYDRSLDDCRNCSTCSKNLIIRRPCSKERDTSCGPFREFINFQQSPDDNEYVDPEYVHPDHHNHKHKHHPHGKNKDTKLPVAPSSELHILPLEPTDRQVSQNSVLDLTSEVSSAGEHQWRTLAMALIGILCIVSVSLVFFVFTVCYIKRKRQAVEKEIFYDPEMMDCQNAYIQVHQPYTSSRDRLKSKSNIRALREFQQNAYDSGSDDSSQAPPPPSSMLLGGQVIGPIVVDEYDADNSGQTVTTTRSSDYVYFNSPQNANGEP